MASAPRRSRPLRRKTSHSVIERRRREKINEGLISLQQSIPACRQELRELLQCKVKSNRKNAKKSEDELQDEAEELLQEKIGSQMVLEKLVRLNRKEEKILRCVLIGLSYTLFTQCIISHTVDYVRELQEKVEAYRQLCESSPPLRGTTTSKTHDTAHLRDLLQQNNNPTVSSSSTEDETPDHGLSIPDCRDCEIALRGKRHWGSNNPLHLTRKAKDPSEHLRLQKRKAINPPEGGPRETCGGIKSSRRSTPNDVESDGSDLELDDWRGGEHICASLLYTNCTQPAPSSSSSSSPPLASPATIITTSTSRKRRATFDTLATTSAVDRTPVDGHSDARLGLLAHVSAELQRSSPEQHSA